MCGAGHVQAFGNCLRRDRARCSAQWLHQMRADLGRLAASAESLQIGPPVGRQPWSRSRRGAMLRTKSLRSISMRIFRAAALAALLAGLSAPVLAQTPNINLMPEFAEQDARGEGSGRDQGKSLPGIVEENTRRQGLQRSVGHGAHRRAAQGRVGQAEDQDRQHRELDNSSSQAAPTVARIRRPRAASARAAFPKTHSAAWRNMIAGGAAYRYWALKSPVPIRPRELEKGSTIVDAGTIPGRWH